MQPGSLQPSDYPMSLPSEVVDGEHFTTANLLNLIVGSVSPSRVLEAETSSQELVSRAISGSSAFTSGGSGSAQPAPSRGERGSSLESLPLSRNGTSSAPRVLRIKKRGANWGKNAPGA